MKQADTNNNFWHSLQKFFKNDNTAERASADPTFNFFYQRFCLAYKETSEMISGNVLEAGTGTGYGLQWILPKVESLLGIDKYDTSSWINTSQYPNLTLKKMRFPPLTGIPDNSFDYVISFHVIEHIKKDRFFLQEIHRVLKPNGKFIVSTPNILMSLARNPFHIREYTPNQFRELLANVFSTVDTYGVFGNEKAMQHYLNNKAGIEKITKFDIFRFQKWVPSFILRIPYEMLNRLNRLRMYKKHKESVSDIKMDDFYIAPINDECIDLFSICTK